MEEQPLPGCAHSQTQCLCLLCVIASNPSLAVALYSPGDSGKRVTYYVENMLLNMLTGCHDAWLFLDSLIRTFVCLFVRLRV